MVKRKHHRHHPGKDHNALPTSSHLLIPLVMFVNILLCLFLASCTGSVQLARHTRMFRFLHSCFWKLTRYTYRFNFVLDVNIVIYRGFRSLDLRSFYLTLQSSTHPSPALALFTITTHTDVWTWVIHTLPPHPRALLLVLHFFGSTYSFFTFFT